MEAYLAYWPFWIGLFLVGTIAFALFSQPTKTTSPKGKHFSRPIHTHPLFKVAGVFVMGFIIFRIL